MTDTRLAAENLTYRRGASPLFTALNFSLEAGQTLLIEGPNGSGKSSLLMLVAGFATPDAGQITYQQQPIYTHLTDYQALLHYVGHLNGTKLGLTVLENLQLIVRLALQARDNVEEVLRSFQLQSIRNQPLNHLSAGQKRRVALARLVLISKPIWILDEPLTALDHDMQLFFLNCMHQHLKNGGRILMSSHQALPLTDFPIRRLRLRPCDA